MIYTVISRKNFRCPYCKEAVGALDKRGLPYRLRKLTGDTLISEAEKAGMNTVPIIYFGEELIGGYDGLMKHLEKDT